MEYKALFYLVILERRKEISRYFILHFFFINLGSIHIMVSFAFYQVFENSVLKLNVKSVEIIFDLLNNNFRD